MVKKRYYILTGGMILLGLLMAFLPEQKSNKELTADQLLAEINYDTRFWSTDQVAKMIIDEDPLLLLVDVRTAEEYNAFHLPGALNIPLQEITKPDWSGYFYQNVKEIVLYSNGTIYASQAWMLLRRKAYKNLYVMKGGLNEWVETIMRPTAPPRLAPVSEHELYQFRLGAKAFFGGGTGDDAATQPKQQAAPVIKKKKKTAVEGGC